MLGTGAYSIQSTNTLKYSMLFIMLLDSFDCIGDLFTTRRCCTNFYSSTKNNRKI